MAALGAAFSYDYDKCEVDNFQEKMKKKKKIRSGSRGTARLPSGADPGIFCWWGPNFTLLYFTSHSIASASSTV